MATRAPEQEYTPRQERYGSLRIFKRAVCLVYTDDKGQLQIDETVLKEISLIDEKVAVVAVIGDYRTGKSYLMNKLVGKSKVFSLGHSTCAATKGIWVMCKCHPTVQNQVMIFLDTEGLSDVAKRDQQHDTKIFCLTMLMSSVLIHNVKGVIDQNTLKKLSFITEVSKVIKDDEKETAALRMISPYFVLCLRDFFLDLDDGGDKLTPDEYMERSLQESQDQQHDEEFNSVRRSINRLLPKRKCFPLAQPAYNKQLKNIEALPEKELDIDFKKGFQELNTFVHESGTKHLDRDASMNGNTFGMLLSICKDALSKGKKMEYISSMEAVTMKHNEKLQNDVCEKYQTELNELALPEPSKQKLTKKLTDIRTKLLKEFRQDAYPYRVSEYEGSCMEKMKSMMDVALKKNSSLVQERCYSYYYEKRKKMIQNNKERYMDFHEYEKDNDALLKKYNEKFDSYDKEERDMAVEKVIKDTKDQELEMKHESKLRESEHKMETLRKQDEEEMKRKIDAFKKEQDDKIKAQMDSNNQLLRKRDEDSKRTIEELKKEQANKLKEQSDYNKETLRKTEEDFKRRIDELKNEQAEKDKAIEHLKVVHVPEANECAAMAFAYGVGAIASAFLRK